MEAKFYHSISNDINEIEALTSLLIDFGTKNNIPEKIINTFNIAFDELISNTIFYGFDKLQNGIVQIEMTLTNNLLVACIIDNGNAFDPFNAPEPDLESDAETKKIGGLGIHIVKNMMDEMTYEFKNNENRVTLKKKIK